MNGELTMKNGKWEIDNGELWWVGLIGDFDLREVICL